MSKQGKKSQVLTELLSVCEGKNNLVFDNRLIKELCKKYDFGNPFDVTKLDDTSKFPEVMIEKDYFVVHLGKGRHQFVKGIGLGFHSFEAIPEQDCTTWPYKKSLLNEFDTSESNILSVGFNQKIIHDFLYEDIIASPKVYNARRTKSSLNYAIGSNNVQTNGLQMEIDLTMELDGVVTVFEGKNNFPENFAVYQVYLPYFYYQNLKKSNNVPIKNVTCCYLLRKKINGMSVIRIYNYGFTTDSDMSSIKLLKAKQYNLVQR